MHLKWKNKSGFLKQRHIINLRDYKKLKKKCQILYSLSDVYSIIGIVDGIVINIEFSYKERKKSIRIENYYQEDIGEIISILNSYLAEKCCVIGYKKI